LKVFDLQFSDGKRCRCIIPEPESDESELSNLKGMFGSDRLESMSRIVAPPPEKLPWKKVGSHWEIGQFKLRKCAPDPDGLQVWCLDYPGVSAYLDAKGVADTVRREWQYSV
jgi:hypothetical protein